MQDAVDAGALAGAQDLIGTVANPNGLPAQALYHAQQDAFSVFSLAAIGQPSDGAYQQPSVTQSQGGYTVTTVAPTGYNNKQVEVTCPLMRWRLSSRSWASARSTSSRRRRLKPGPTPSRTPFSPTAAWEPATPSRRNLPAMARSTTGQDGADACNLSGAGVSISNAKFHIPTSSGILNINGRLIINQGSDNQNMAEFWSTAPAFGTGADPKPTTRRPIPRW